MSKVLSIILGVPLGISFVVYANFYYEIVGDINWCDTVFGRAGTYTFMKILGVIIVFGCIMYSMGLFDSAMNSLDAVKPRSY
jgi:hypothetical protein